MSVTDRWLLPDGIEDLLPLEANRLEHMRRKLFALYDSWGYELVIPPLIEYLESLLVGAGNDLDRSTFKLIDRSTGRLMGVRADITPQVARIDAHRVQKAGPGRYCYWGPVLLTQPRELGGSRSPIQAGAELYGHGGVESDLEILRLMLQSLKVAGIEDSYLDLGHVGVFRGLVRQGGIDAELEAGLFDALQRKARPEMQQLLAQVKDAAVAAMLDSLIDLNGGSEILAEAGVALRQAGEEVQQALATLEAIGAVLHEEGVRLHIDLAELRGYGYHSGVVFAAYSQGHGLAVAQGGRYDGIGAAFGRARPATGYSMDLRTLILLKQGRPKKRKGIFVPANVAARLGDVVAELRAQGERVICELPGQTGGAAECGCDRRLVDDENGWRVESIET